MNDLIFHFFFFFSFFPTAQQRKLSDDLSQSGRNIDVGRSCWSVTRPTMWNIPSSSDGICTASWDFLTTSWSRGSQYWTLNWRFTPFTSFFLHLFPSTAAAKASAPSPSNPSRFPAKTFPQRTKFRSTQFLLYTPRRPTPWRRTKSAASSSGRWCSWVITRCRRATRGHRNPRPAPAQRLPTSPTSPARTFSSIR